MMMNHSIQLQQVTDSRTKTQGRMTGDMEHVYKTGDTVNTTRTERKRERSGNGNRNGDEKCLGAEGMLGPHTGVGTGVVALV